MKMSTFMPKKPLMKVSGRKMNVTQESLRGLAELRFISVVEY